MRVEEREGKPSLVADIELIDAPDGWVLGMVLDKGHFGITCYATPVEPAEEIVEDLELAEWDLDTGKKKYKPGGVIEVKDDVEITNVPFIMDRKRDKE